MKTVEQLAQSTNPALVRAFGSIRRFVVTLTDSAIWQVAGVLMPDGREAMRAEVFGVVGVYARPPANVEAEVIAVMVGDATTPTVVGVRDEQTRAAAVSDIEADESALYNTLARVYVKDDGTIEARTHAGIAVPLCKHSDMVSLKSAFTNWVVAPSDGGGALKTLLTTLIGTGWPFGTTKIKGE